MRDRILLWIAHIVWRRPRVIVAAAMIVAIASGMYAANSLVLNANTDDLVAPDRPYMVEYRRLLEEFGDLEHIFVVVENHTDPQRTQAIVDALTAKLRTIRDLPAVHSAIEPHEQLRLTPRAMPEDELEDFVLASGAFPALASGDAGRVLNEASELLSRLVQAGARMDEQEQRRTGAAAVFLVKAIAAALETSPSRSDLQFLIQPPPRQYFKSDTGRFYFIDITPAKDYSTLSVVEEPLRNIRAAIEEIRRDFPGATIGLTGKPVLQADEMATSNADMTKASIVAFILCAALFMYSFGGFWKPLLAVIAFACAGAWTYGFATLAVGQLNLLSIVFMLVLIGVGLDYGVHVLTRYREFRATLDVRESIAQAIVTAGRGNLTGALTSSAVFFMALVTSFQGLRELGLIAGAGLLLCVTAMIIVLPALLVMAERYRARKSKGVLPAPIAQSSAGFGSRIFAALNAHPIPVLIVAGVLSLGLVFSPGAWRFEHNLLELQARGLESVEWERRILEDSAAASWFGAIIANSQDQVIEIMSRARQYPSIGSIRSVFEVIPPQSQRRDELRQQLQSVSLAENQSPTQWSANELDQATGALDLMAVGAARQAPEEARELKQVSDDLKSLVDQLKGDESNAAVIRVHIEQTVAAIGSSLQNILEGNQRDLRTALPDALRDQYVSTAGRYLAMLHQREDVWEYEPMKQFVADLRAVDPDVTGAPISHFESLGDMQRAFMLMAIFSFIVIAILIWLDFGSAKLTVIALLPTFFGLMWLFEVMAVLEISFNLANFFSVPILIGLSVDGSVHVLHRFVEDRERTLDLGDTRKAVIVTALTTTIGFGCVMLAHHRGLRSLGQVMAIGSISCLIASIVLLPAIMAVLARWGGFRHHGR